MGTVEGRSVLRNISYSFIGNRNRALLDEARRRHPQARGARLASIIIELREGPVGGDSPQPEWQFFERWVRERNGELPGLEHSERMCGFRSPEEERDVEDLRWTGLAVLISLGGAAYTPRSATSPSSFPSGVRRGSTDVSSLGALAHRRGELLAAASRVAGATSLGESPFPRRNGKHTDILVFTLCAGDLSLLNAGDPAGIVAQAIAWWSGSKRSWNVLRDSLDLTASQVIPSDVSALVLAVYEGPTSAPAEQAGRAGQLASLHRKIRAGKHRLTGMFTLDDLERLRVLGFHE